MSSAPGPRVHQSWYWAVAQAGRASDDLDLTLEEAREELANAPFVEAPDFRDLALNAERDQGMTDALVAAMGEGSRLALGLLIERCQERIRGMIRSKLGSSLRMHVDTREVLQEVNLQLLRSLRDYEPRDHSTFVAWLYTVVRNRVLKLADETDRRLERPLGQDLIENLPAPDRGRPRAEETVERGLAVLAERRPVEATALRLQLERHPVRRIAREIGRTEAATAMVLVRARTHLAEILARLDETDPERGSGSD